MTKQIMMKTVSIMNLADPELELVDPTPNIHNLFVHFDQIFFYTKLLGRAVVRWSKRMYSCAGICSYEGRGGLCDIALSEPLLKLRPRKDLVETLLHEMIHAFLFITNRDSDRDGHGPNFQAHMHRINRAAGLNISIYHDFHDEVKLYLKHWWRCNGRCRNMKPYFGTVRRSSNRAPGPNDFWWKTHQRSCGGTFIKIKEPEKVQKPTKRTEKGKTNADITKYINNNTDNMNKNYYKDLNKENKVVNKPNVNRPIPNSPKTPRVTNPGDVNRRRSNSNSVIETVRNVWLNKQIPTLNAGKTQPVQAKPTNEPHTNKHKGGSIIYIDSPPKKIKKIDDYFKNTASSILKDVYGTEFIISQSSNSKLKAFTVDTEKMRSVQEKQSFVDCPSCNIKVNSKDINRHLDECLNKGIIEEMNKEFINTPARDKQKSPSIVVNTESYSQIRHKQTDKAKLKDIVGDIQAIPNFNNKSDLTRIDITQKQQTYKGQSKTSRKSFDSYHTDVSKPSTSKENSIQLCLTCGIEVQVPMETHLDDCLGFFDNNTTIPEEGVSQLETAIIEDVNIKPSTSKEDIVQKCPCCGIKVDKPIEFHLDECLAFFDNDTTIPKEKESTVETILIDEDDDIFDESQTLNATGTKSPCPSCLKMIEMADMNDHLDVCIT